MLSVRFRVDFSDRCAVGPGKIELLEAISRSGSLSQAARDLRMSYRRAWLLVRDLNVGFRKPVTVGSIGGRGGGVMLLTEFGRQVISGYRMLQKDIHKCLLARMREIDAEALQTPTARLAKRKRIG